MAPHTGPADARVEAEVSGDQAEESTAPAEAEQQEDEANDGDDAPASWRERLEEWWVAKFGTRARTPTVLQMEAAECGAAALAMVLAHHGRFVSLEELRTACGVSRDGSKASNIIRAASRYGLEAAAFKLELAELSQVPLPAILHWNFNHFLVLEGIRGRRVFLNDPASGPRQVDIDEVDQCFTGVALAFEPADGFQPGGDRAGLVDAFEDRLPSIAPAMFYAVLAGIGLIIPGLAIPTFSRVFVDEVLIGNKVTWLPALLAGMLLTAALRATLLYAQQHTLLQARLKLDIVGASTFMWNVLRLPVPFFASRAAGDLASRVALNERLSEVLASRLVQGFVDLTSVVFYFILLMWFDYKLTLIVIIVAILSIVIHRVLSRRRIDEARRLQNDAGRLAGISMSGLQLIETLKAGGGESDFFARWAGHHAGVALTQQQMARSGALLATVPAFVRALGNVAVVSVGAWQVMNGQLTIGGLVAFQSLAATFVGPFEGLLQLATTLQEAEGDVSRLADVVQSRPDPHARSTDVAVAGSAPVRLAGHLRLENVSFGYSPLEPPLIRDFSLELQPGQRVALVGGSGSGKSTLAKVISGLYPPWSGSILFDGYPQEKLPRSVFVNSVSVVDQEIFLFEGTVRDNLTLWDQTVPDAVVIAAAKDACIHDDIVSRPGGYEGQVEEEGRNFSGGQRQRLEIARSLVVSPSLLLLDEATSALDPTTERLVDDNLRRRGTTCVIIAHRLSTIRDCDEIIVLEKGVVVERGTHDNLMAAGGAYSRLVLADEGRDAGAPT